MRFREVTPNPLINRTCVRQAGYQRRYAYSKAPLAVCAEYA